MAATTAADPSTDSSIDSDNSGGKRKIKLLHQLKQEIVELQNENKELRAMAKKPSPKLVAPAPATGKENASDCAPIITRSKRLSVQSKSEPAAVTKPTTKGKVTRKPLDSIVNTNKRVKHI